MGAFLLALIVGVFSASPFGERDVAYAQTQDDNRLRSLSITGVSLSPAFNRDTTTYSARVPNATTSVQVMATTNNRAAAAAIGGTAVGTGLTVENLSAGNNPIIVIVTPERLGAATGTYTIIVYRGSEDPTNVATLASWALNVGEANLLQTIQVATSANVKVRHNVEKVALVAAATDDGAIVQVGNVKYNKSITSTAPRNIDLNGKGFKTEIRLTVTPEDGSSSASYTITVYRERAVLSSDNNLRNLSLGSGITLMPSFSSSKTAYTARVRNSIDHATVTSTLSDQAGGASASRTVPASDGETADSRPASGDQVELTAGAETPITVEVTAEDGIAKTYTVVVYRENYEKNDVKTLSALTYTPPGTDATAVTPEGFVADASSPDMFTATVANDVSSVTVRATPSDAGAMGSITPADASSGSADHQVNLATDAVTTITVTVTAEDGSTKDYTIKVYRSASTLSTDNTLKSLTVTGLTASGSTTEIFTPTIPRLVGNVATINVRVRTATSNVKIEGTGHPAATVGIPVGATSDAGQDLTAGEAANIEVTVTPQDTVGGAATGTYMIRVYRERADRSDNKTLSALTYTPPGTGATAVTPEGFVADASSPDMFTATVANDVSSVTVRATPSDAGAMGSITPADASSGSADHQVNLTAGAETTITVTVTAEDGSTKDYTITVFRMRSLVSDNATLGSLTVTDASSGAAQTLDPAFAPSKTNYRVRVANSVNEVTIAAETAVVGATRVFDGAPDDDPATDGRQVFLSAGLPRDFTITVMAENSTAEAPNTKRYTITLYRERATPSDNANLASLANNGLTLDAGVWTPPTYSPSRTDYRVVVGNGVGSVTVSANAADVGADVDIMPADTDSNVAGDQVSLTVGAETSITVTVTAEDGSTTKTYTVAVYRERAPKSDDATLSALTLDGAVLSPAFDSNVTTYTARAAYGSDEVTLSYTSDIGAVEIDVQGGRPSSVLNTVSMSRRSATVRLYTTGETQIEIDVTAEDNTATKRYIITVSYGSGPSSDATLSSLMLSGVTLSPAFDPATTAYTAEVETLETTMVEAMGAHPGATVRGTGEKSLTVGENVIMVTVTAEDETTQIYTVTVTVLMGGTLLDRYDANDNNQIDKGEVLTAIEDFLIHKTTTKEEVLDLILLYLAR